MLSLNLIFLIDNHVVTEIIKSELVICTICNISIISFPLLLLVHACKHNADRSVQEVEHLAHFLRLELSKIVVYCYNVNALSCKGVSISRQTGNESFTFTCFHFGDTSLMKNDSTDYLNRVRLFAKHSERSFTANRKGVRKNVIKS